MPLPIREPESFTPCVPIVLPSILPTNVWAVGPVSAPAAVKALIATESLPVTVLFRTWNVRFEIWDSSMSMPCPLPVNVLFWTVKLFVIVPPELDPILPESFVWIWMRRPGRR